jgi:integrase
MLHPINLEPTQEALDGRNLNTLIRLWVEHCQRRSDLDPHTVAGYASKVGYFCEWWEAVGPWCGYELTRERLLQFGDWLATVKSQYGKPLSYNSRKDVMRRLRQVFRWAHEREYTSRNFAIWLPDVSGSEPLRERASVDELAQLMLAAGKGGCPVRDQALVAFLIGTGLRKMEAVGVDVGDVRMDADQSGTVAVHNAKRVGGRSVQGRVVAFDAWTGAYLAKLMDTYPEQSGPLFRIPEGTRRIGGEAAYRIVKRAIKRAGLERRIQGPHDLRRAFATWFSLTHRGELEGRLLSKQLGHSRFAQTDKYILHDASDLRDVITSPLASYPLPPPEGEGVVARQGLLPEKRGNLLRHFR